MIDKWYKLPQINSPKSFKMLPTSSWLSTADPSRAPLPSTLNDLETYDVPGGGLLDPLWQREIFIALLMLRFSFKNHIEPPWSSNEMHSHDNIQSLMFITFQNKKISSVFTLCLLNRKKMKGANRGKTTMIISNSLSYPFHLDALITVWQRAKSGVPRAQK